MISHAELMQDLAFGFMVESARRELYGCEDLEKMRQLSLNVLSLLEGQRIVVQQLIQENKLDPKVKVKKPPKRNDLLD